MTVQSPARLLAAEKTLIDQLNAVGAARAAKKLAKTGLPTRRVEAYHYTDLKNLIKLVPELAGGAEHSGAPKLDLAGAFLLAMSNGRVPQAANPPAGLVVSSQRGSPLSARDDVLVELNRALVGDCRSGVGGCRNRNRGRGGGALDFCAQRGTDCRSKDLWRAGHGQKRYLP